MVVAFAPVAQAGDVVPLLRAETPGVLDRERAGVVRPVAVRIGVGTDHGAVRVVFVPRDQPIHPPPARHPVALSPRGQRPPDVRYGARTLHRPSHPDVRYGARTLPPPDPGPT